MTARRGLAYAGVALAAALVTGRLAAGVYADWAWYGAMGAASLWNARLEALTALRLGLFVIAFVFAFANLLVMRRSIVSLVLPRQLGNLVIGEAVAGSTLTWVAVLMSVLIAGVLALSQDGWLGLLRALWARPAGEVDPYLGRDLSFWLGWLPFERGMQAWCVLLGVVVGFAVLALYALTPSMRLDRGRVHVSTRARRHFAVYTGVLLLLVAWGYRLDAFDLLIHGSGVRETFVAFDHQVLYPYLIALSIGTAAVAVLVAWTGWRGQQRATIGALLLIVVAGPVGSVVLPVLDRGAATDRERAQLDRPYRHVRALYTRRAYRLEEVRRGPAADSLRANAARLSAAVSSWDPAALARALADETGVLAMEGTTGWRVTPAGRLRASVLLGTATSDAARVPLASREADPTDADDRGAPWPVADAAVASVPPLAVGEGLVSVLPVDDTLGHVAAPAFPPGWRRIALAWSVRSLGLAAGDTDAGDGHAKLLLRRDVRERVQTVLPFFAAGVTPQPMVAGDSLWWVVELFNTSDDYPLSEPVLLDGVEQRFAAAAGLALVNAHSGRIRVLLPAHVDKVTRWWLGHLPVLFVTPRAVDPAMRAALPAPVDRAALQGAALARVGFADDTLSTRPLFLVDDADVDAQRMAPAPFVSGGAATPLAWGVPVVDALDHLRGAFVAVGGAQSGTAFVEAPEPLRWSSVVDRLQRVADSTAAIRSTPHLRHGRVQVIPATDGLHMAQSFYDWAPQRAPALAGVVTLHGAEAHAGPTLAAALGDLPRAMGADGNLRTRIARLYIEMQDALRRNDWTAFGRAMETLRRLGTGRP